MKGTIRWLLLLLSSQACRGQRMWTDVDTLHSLSPFDSDIVDYLFEHDPLRFTMSPSAGPSASPSNSPSVHPSNVPSDSPSKTPTASPEPSMLPSSDPSVRPTVTPSADPTVTPSVEPTGYPSATPSDAPSAERFPPNPPPVDADGSYFNYDDGPGALWGPGVPELVMHNATTWRIEYQNNAWSTRVPPENWYWNEFDENGYGPWGGILANKNPRRNRCSRPDGRQSPIDVRDNGASCEEHHQVRTRRGDFSLSQENITAEIMPNKLRLHFQRRPCREINLEECMEPDPPHADFPHNWGGFTDVIHVDFKIPSEHLVYGERFDAEMQIFHLHPSRRRTPTVASMMRATQFGYNDVLQDVIDKFQYTFDDHALQCATRMRRERRWLSRVHKLFGTTSSAVDYDSWAEFSTEADAPNATRRLQSGRIFTPHHVKLVPSIYFYAYEGSITEPPCSEFVTWFITDVPMEMSFAQLEQLKRIQFQYVDPHCKKTSIHFQESNARPIQDTFGRAVWHCTPSDFLSDAEMYPQGDVPPPDPVI